MVVYGVFLIVFCILGVYARSYENAFWKEQKKQGEKVWFSDYVGLLLYTYVQKAKMQLEGGVEQEKKRQEQYRAVYIGENEIACRKREQARIWGYIWLIAIGVSLLGLVICGTNSSNALKDGNKLERPPFGTGETSYEITVSGLGEETETVLVTVGEQQPGEAQMNAVFENAFQEVQQEILGENTCLEEVRTNLNFFTMTDQGIRLSWESGSEEWITSYGEITTEEIPEEGVLVPIRIRMTYATYEAWYEFYVRVVPPIKDLVYYKQQLTNLLQVELANNVQSAYAELPRHLEEYELTYQFKTDFSSMYVGALGIVAMIAIGIMSGRTVETLYEKRNQQMMEDYSQIISQLSILILCGMNVRSAWGRIVKDYEKRKIVHNGAMRYAYEEMCLTNRELERGFQESRAYGEFGRRCGIYSYVKLGNLLEQGIRQGTSGMEASLRNEAAEALEGKVHEAKRRGEESETKMLIPMFLMLGIVMAILMVPAFLSF